MAEETGHTTFYAIDATLVLREHCNNLIVLPPSAPPSPTPPRRAASRRPPRRGRRRLRHRYDGRRQFIRDPPEAHQIHRNVPRIVGVERVRLREVEAQLGDDVRDRAPTMGAFQEKSTRGRLMQRVDHVT